MGYVRKSFPCEVPGYEIVACRPSGEPDESVWGYMILLGGEVVAGAESLSQAQGIAAATAKFAALRRGISRTILSAVGGYLNVAVFKLESLDEEGWVDGTSYVIYVGNGAVGWAPSEQLAMDIASFLASFPPPHIGPIKKI
ncbi:MAG TPA: hypothetical protein VED40_23015 [Azospirillaceae bacterium]|nr:hypothetical protein [Azospirillaceae bacterium]